MKKFIIYKYYFSIIYISKVFQIQNQKKFADTDDLRRFTSFLFCEN